MRRALVFCAITSVALGFGCGASNPPVSDAGFGDTAGASEVPGVEHVRNVPADCYREAISSGPGEDGHWIAARLTPPSASFDLHGVRYEIYQGTRPRAAACDASIAHRAAVFLGGDVPTATPKFLRMFDIPTGSAPATDRRVIELRLPSPETVNAPMKVYVAVQYGGSYPNTNCVVTCDSAGTTDRTWWSNAASPPFRWETLASFGFQRDLAALLIGVRR
jgi:hypothetical protein